MNIKTIVKVMNFHALIRVDRAHKEADRLLMLERQITDMMNIIQNNRNLLLDRKKIRTTEEDKRLRIFIGSDLGFCGGVNASANALLAKEDGTNDIIIIGRKLHCSVEPRLWLSREEFDNRYGEIGELIANAVKKNIYSGIDICYDHYHNMGNIEPRVKTIFPITLEQDDENEREKESYSEDFYIEGGDVNDFMERLTITYLNFEVKIATINAFASENILRQAATNESLKRIEEMEQEEVWQKRKELNQKASQKSIDSFSKRKQKENNKN